MFFFLDSIIFNILFYFGNSSFSKFENKTSFLQEQMYSMKECTFVVAMGSIGRKL